MSKEKVRAPSGMAGIVTYYEEEKSLVKIKPIYIFAFIAALAELELFLQGLYKLFIVFLLIFGLAGYWIIKDEK